MSNCSYTSISKVATAIALLPMLLVGGGCVNASNTAESDGRSGVSASRRENSMLENPDESVMVTKSSKPICPKISILLHRQYLPRITSGATGVYGGIICTV